MIYNKLSDFDFNLPDELIATEPAQPRDHSRLLVLDKKTGQIEHKHFYDTIDYLNESDILVLNNSKVIPARLIAHKKDTGGQIEILLHKKISDDIWQCLLGGKVKEGLILFFTLNSVVIPTGAKRSGGIAFVPKKDSSAVRKGFLGSAGVALGMTNGDGLSAEVLKNNNDGTWDIKFNKSGVELMKAIEELGEMPLPPYILSQLKIKNEELKIEDAREFYQTVYANSSKSGSVAAPTAGLHFTPELLEKIKNKGVKILELTLYVGMGTFAPVKTENISEHKMHAEWVEIDSKTIKELLDKREEIRKKKSKNKIIAVGTTSARSLEACFGGILNLTHPVSEYRATPLKMGIKHAAKLSDFKSWVDIFITPGYEFKIVDAMITNFHLPKSTLLMLVSALAGKENIDKAYEEAIENKYRFYSYGDAMFIR